MFYGQYTPNLRQCSSKAKNISRSVDSFIVVIKHGVLEKSDATYFNFMDLQSHSLSSNSKNSLVSASRRRIFTGFHRSCGHWMQLHRILIAQWLSNGPITISMSSGNVSELEHLLSSSHIYKCCFANVFFQALQLIKTSLKLI